MTIRRTGEKRGISLRYSSGPLSPGRGVVRNEALVYPDRDGRIALVVTPRKNGLKEDFVLPRAMGDALSFSWNLTLDEGLTARLAESGEINIFASDQLAARPLYTLPAPVIRDGLGSDLRTNARFELEGSTVKVVATGLSSLTYPLAIDPTVVITSALDWAQNANNEGAFEIDPVSASIRLKSTHRFGPVAWSASANPLPVPGEALGAAAYNGRVYVIGGKANATASAKVLSAAIDPITGELGVWSEQAVTLPSARAGLAVVAYSGYLYAVGGTDSAGTVLDEVLVAKIGNDGTLDAFVTASTLPTARTAHSAVAANGHLYVIAGKTNTGSLSNEVASAPLRGNGLVGAWTIAEAGAMPARERAAAVVHQNTLCVLGGAGASGYLSDVYCALVASDGSLGGWTAAAPLFGGRAGASAAAYDGRLYLAGGESSAGALSELEMTSFLRSGPTLGSWIRSSAQLSEARAEHSLLAHQGRLYAVGGKGSSAIASVEIAAVAQSTIGVDFIDRWQSAGTLPLAKSRAAVAAFGGYAYLSGGLSASGATDELLIAAVSADGTLGAFTSSAVKLTTPRYGHTMAVWDNATRNARFLVTIGGEDGSAFAEPVEWAEIDKATGALKGPFTPVAAAATLGKRSGHGSALISNYLFVGGGRNEAGVLTSDLFIVPFDPGPVGTTGAMLAPVAQTNSIPTARENHALVLHSANDPSRGTSGGDYLWRLFVIGGFNGTEELADVQASTTFQLTTTTVPSTAAGPFSAMASLGRRRQGHAATIALSTLLVFGGSEQGTVLSEVETSLVTATNELVPWRRMPSPLRRPASGLSAFSVADRLVVLGGRAGSQFQDQIETATLVSGPMERWNVSPKLLEQGRSRHLTVASNGYLYVIAGFGVPAENPTGGSANVGDAFYAPILPDGSIGEWARTEKLLPERRQLSGAAWNGYIYAVGGFKGSNSYAQVQVSKIQADGSLGPWEIAGPDFPAPVTGGINAPSVNIHNGVLYVAGGNYFDPAISVNVYRRGVLLAKLDPATGKFAAWEDNVPLFVPGETGRTRLNTAIYRDRLYVVGGYGVDKTVGTIEKYWPDIQMATVNPDGTLGSFQVIGNFGGPLRQDFRVEILNGYLYVIGGGVPRNGTISYDQVHSAPILDDGTLGAWTAAARLPRVLRWPGTTVYNGRLYITGGSEPSGTGLLNTKATWIGEGRAGSPGLYSQRVDLGAMNTVNSIRIDAPSTNRSELRLSYRVAAEDAVFGPLKSTAALPVGATFTLNEPDVRYVWTQWSLDGIDNTTVDGPGDALDSVTLSYQALRLAFVDAPSTVEAGACTAGGTVELRERTGSADPAPSDKLVTLQTTCAGGAFFANASCTGEPLSEVSISAGQTASAPFYLKATGAASCQLSAATSDASPGTAALVVTSSAPVRLRFQTTLGTATAGRPHDPAIDVVVQDQFGNTVPGSTHSVTVTLGTNPSGATLSGTGSSVAQQGLARFADLSLNKVGAGYTLVASASGLSSGTSNAFSVVAGALAKISVDAPPKAAVRTPVVAQVRLFDGLDNPRRTSALQICISGSTRITDSSLTDSYRTAGCISGGTTVGGEASVTFEADSTEAVQVCADVDGIHQCADVQPTEAATGCGCGAGPAEGSMIWFALLLLLPLARHRRLMRVW